VISINYNIHKQFIQLYTLILHIKLVQLSSMYILCIIVATVFFSKCRTSCMRYWIRSGWRGGY